MVDFDAPTTFVVAMFVMCALGFVAPLRIEGREDYLLTAYVTPLAASVLGSESIVVLWGSLLLAVPLQLVRHGLATRDVRLAVRAAATSIGYGAVTASAVSAGIVVGLAVWIGPLEGGFPIPLAGTEDMFRALAAGGAAWAATMAVRILTLRMMTGALLPRALDPFDSILIPYALPVIGGLPLVAASIAAYDAADPWHSIFILSWAFPLYGASWYELHRREIALELRRELLARQRLAAIGEVSARIVHQSRHQVGLMGWSVHRLRALVGATTPDLEASYAELDALDAAKDRLSEMLASELLHEPAPDESEPAAARVVTFADAIDDVVRQLSDEAVRSDVTLRADVDAELGARWVASSVRDVVFNLVDNAIDAAATAVEVQLRASVDQAPANVEIRVIDDGPGVAETDVDRSFEPFFTTKVDGTGMGLAIAEALVGELDGSLRYERNAGRTLFVVAVPATPG